ncbi:MFS-type transporter SLC18B1-like isoform X3 [Stylophora pistillata]|uniref:MFS-type transporter SLC18B1-like isoform X3 n=1 Tax=Stylophora pistillata TaxID=50429 RepID=UPI000C05567C|nr:MFS-type transporter SLC18B1-like isoform X3 [Stylophora pistillata]
MEDVSSPEISFTNQRNGLSNDSYRSNERVQNSGSLCTVRNIFIIVSLCIVYFVVFEAYSVYSPFFPSEARDKGVSGTIVGLLFGTYSFVVFIFSPFCGVLIPKYGPRFVLYTGLVLCGGSMVLFGFGGMIVDRDAFIALCFLLRATSAIGGAAAETSALSILLEKFPDNVGMVTVGGFKLPFIVTGGTMIAVIPVLVLILGKGDKEDSDKESISMLEALKIPTALMLSLCFAACGLSFSYLEPIIGPHLKQMGQNPTQIGLAFLYWSGTYALLAPIVGCIGDRMKCYRTMMIAGFTGFAIGHLLVGPAPFLTFLPTKTIWLVILAMFLYGIAGGFAFVPIMPDLIKTLRANGFPDNSSTNALVSSIYSSMYYLGATIGPSLSGALDDHFGFGWSTSIAAFICLFQVLLVCFFTLREIFSLRENSDSSEREPLAVNNRGRTTID